MNGMIHYLPTPDVPWQHDVPCNGRYEGSAPFNLGLVLADLTDGRIRTDPMSRIHFNSLPTYAAYMGAGWADVYAGRYVR
jgi:hypothetical protein